MKNFLKKISENTWKIILFAGIALLFLVLDFISKQIVLNNMDVGQVINIIPNFFYFQYVINDGMAFGLNFNMKGWEVANKIIFITVSVIGTGIITWIFVKTHKKLKNLVVASLGLMLAGCVGNLIDRIFYTQSYLASHAAGVETYGVVDFIAFDFGSYSFPRFNIADSCLVIGVIILVIYLIIEEVKDAKKRKALEEKEMPEGKVMSKDEAILNQEKPQEEAVEETSKDEPTEVQAKEEPQEENKE